MESAEKCGLEWITSASRCVGGVFDCGECVKFWESCDCDPSCEVPASCDVV